ncbi:RDD family protein [Granulicoccus phenolivorans]|uniref:RDD family protein n=1 Tax=Granulicoccus phenolivorans TaxID=266854 RepID=UPI0004288B59|nr:RDD family protein [Granulicoccus phenolivorans]
MRRHPWRRIAAWLIDCGLIMLYAGLLALVGVPLTRAGVLGPLPLAAANVLAALVLVVPVVLVLAGLEAGRRAATVGKRVLGLRLAGAAGAGAAGTGAPGAPGYPRALLRNAVKVALPWLIAHSAVYGIWDGSARGAVPGWVWPAFAVAYAIPLVWLVTLFVGTGRTPYDRLARVSVIEASGDAATRA